jgi:hypothetical protein
MRWGRIDVPKTVVSPTRTAPSAVHFGDWEVETPSKRLPLGELPPWDYATELVLTCEVLIDLESVLTQCALDESTTELVVASTVECIDTYWKTTQFNTVTDRRVRVRIEVPRGVVAKSVHLQRRVVVGCSRRTGDVLTPTRGHYVAGLDDGTRLTLEGDGGRFPTEGVHFSSEGLPDAPWHLSLTYDDPSDSFSGAVQLLLNLDHPEVRTLALELEDQEPVNPMLESFLSYDVARQLVLRAVVDERLVQGRSWDEGSVGWTLEGICARTSSGTAARCRNSFQLDPGTFETKLKAEFGMLP